MDLRKELIDFCLDRYKNDPWESELKISIDVDRYLKRKNINSMSECERQPVGNNEQGESITTRLRCSCGFETKSAKMMDVHIEKRRCYT